MSIFLLVYFSIYGGMNLYLFGKVYFAFRPTGLRLLLIALFMLLMVTGPIFVRMLERVDLLLPARLLALVTYIWMAAALWFLFMGLVVDIYNITLRIFALPVPGFSRFLIPLRTSLAVIAVIILAGMVWGLVENSRVRVENVSIRTPLLKPGSSPIRITQISDLHLGLIVGRSRLEKVISLIRETDPHILVATGDMLDGMAPHLDDISGMFEELQPPMGKFAVMGNHEYYVGISKSVKFHERAGFRVLRGESILAGENILIAGVDDPAGSRVGRASWTDESAALPDSSPPVFTVLLKHQPVISDKSRGKFNLQLSGHSHGGQIFPFNILVKRRYPMMKGLHDLASGSYIYTSRGSGTWGPPFRVLSPPEVALITILPENTL
jgi:predicted MPP superfamily phosphohydrolase